MPVTQKKPQADTQAQTLGVNELHGLALEAFEAHDAQDERKRFDSRGRKWVFGPAKVKDCSVLSLSIETPAMVAEDHISTQYLGSDLAMPMIDDVIRKLDGKLA